MNHKFILYTFALLFAACGNSPKRGGTTTIYTNPVIMADAPDPSVIRTDDGSYYLYATGHGYSIFRSEDLVTWEHGPRQSVTVAEAIYGLLKFVV